jgi:adenylate cyclase
MWWIDRSAGDDKNKCGVAAKITSSKRLLDPPYPYLPVWCVEERGVAFYAQERYREAIAHLSALPFQTRRSRLYQIAAHIALGEKDQAQKLARAALAVQPDLTTKYVRDQEWYRDRAGLKKIMERLVEAGVPEESER